MDLVVMSYKDPKVGDIAVPEETVASHEAMGWKRANKTKQAEAADVAAANLPDPTATA